MNCWPWATSGAATITLPTSLSGRRPTASSWRGWGTSCSSACGGGRGTAICTPPAPATSPPPSALWRPTRRSGESPCAWCASPRPRWPSWRSSSPAGSPAPPTGTGTTICTTSTAWPTWGARSSTPSATTSTALRRTTPPGFTRRSPPPACPSAWRWIRSGTAAPSSGRGRWRSGIWAMRASPCAPPWSTMRSWAWRAGSSGCTARWWPSPSATGCPPIPTTSTSKRPTASSRGPTP